MRTLTNLAAVLIIMALAFWAYRENYRTQAVLDEMQTVQGQIARLRERLGTLNAEWAYLNRPARLAQLVELNADKLKLKPLTPDQMLRPTQIAYALPRALPLVLPDGFADDLLARGQPGGEAADPDAPRAADAPRPRPAHLLRTMP